MITNKVLNSKNPLPKRYKCSSCNKAEARLIFQTRPLCKNCRFDDHTQKAKKEGNKAICGV